MYTNSDTVNSARPNERNTDFLQQATKGTVAGQLPSSTNHPPERSKAGNSPGPPTALPRIPIRVFGQNLEEFRDRSVVVGGEGAGDHVLELTDRVPRYEARHCWLQSTLSDHVWGSCDIHMQRYSHSKRA